MMDSVLFCSAIEQELIGLNPIIKNKLPLGVGNMDAMINLNLYLNSHKNIQEIIFIGSAGTYQPKLCPELSIASGKDYYYRELSTWKNESYSPDLMETYVPLNEGDCAIDLFKTWNLEKHKINSPNSISLLSTNQLPEWKNGPVLENMEVFGVAKLAQKLKLKFASIFGITNVVGPNGSLHWKNNYKQIAQVLIQELNFALTKNKIYLQ